MPRAALSVAEVFRRYGDVFRAEVGAALSTEVVPLFRTAG